MHMSELTVTPEQDEVFKTRATALANMLAANPYRHGQKDWGRPKEANPCGTTACVAGWSLLANRGIVTITPDGEMTYDESALGRTGDEVRYTADLYGLSDAELEALTLWRSSYSYDAAREGQSWLGLSREVADALFRFTADSAISNQEATAVEILRRLADGRISRNDYLSLWTVEEIDTEITASMQEDDLRDWAEGAAQD